MSSGILGGGVDRLEILRRTASRSEQAGGGVNETGVWEGEEAEWKAGQARGVEERGD